MNSLCRVGTDGIMSKIFKASEPVKDRIISVDIDSSRQLSAFEMKLLNIRREAEAARTEAENSAKDIIALAHSEAGKIRDDARLEGIEQGKAESLAKIEELAKSLLSEIDKAVQTQNELIRKAREGVIDFTFKLTKLILGSEVCENPDIVEKHLARLLERLNVEGKVKIYISDEDFDTIESYLQDSAYNMDSGGYEIMVDTSLSRGGIRVDASSMGIDGSFEGMLQRVETVVRNMLSENE